MYMIKVFKWNTRLAYKVVYVSHDLFIFIFYIRNKNINKKLNYLNTLLINLLSYLIKREN